MILVTVLVQRMRPPEVIVEAPVVENVSRRRGRKISMDAAFDDPEYDPFDSDKKKRGPKRGSDGSDAERASPEPERIDGDLAGAFEELTGESPQEGSVTEESTGTVTAAVDEALDNEDIEALFDD